VTARILYTVVQEVAVLVEAVGFVEADAYLARDRLIDATRQLTRIRRAASREGGREIDGPTGPRQDFGDQRT
jgi:hypothetical protein